MTEITYFLLCDAMEKRLEQKIFTYSSYLLRKFGRKVFRVGLSTGIPCPHRVKNGGCIFCNPKAFIGDYQNEKFSISEQLEEGIKLIKKCCGNVKFLAYFQDETSTAGNTKFLEKIFSEAISHPEVLGLVISTRPDFIDERIVEMLSSFKLPVTIEIGMQTIHDSSLTFLNRGHSFRQTEKAIELCGKAGLEVGVHLILGIPGENFEDMRETIQFVSGEKFIKQVKFHNLVVYKDTRLSEMIKTRNIPILSIDDYIIILGNLLPYLRGDIVITRLFTSNILNSHLTIGKYSGNKTKWMNSLRKYLYNRDIVQGSETEVRFDNSNISV